MKKKYEYEDKYREYIKEYNEQMKCSKKNWIYRDKRYTNKGKSQKQNK